MRSDLNTIHDDLLPAGIAPSRSISLADLPRLADHIPVSPNWPMVDKLRFELETFPPLTCAEDRKRLGELRGNAKQELKTVQDHFDPYIKAAFALHRAMTGRLNGAREELQTQLDRTEKIQREYDTEQERIHQAEIDRARREQETIRQAAIAEANRLAREEAERLRAEGEAREAEQLLARRAAEAEMERHAPIVEIIEPAPAMLKVEGESTRTTYRAEVVDLQALVKAAAENFGLLGGLVQVNQKALDSLARSSREMFRVPGCRIIQEKSYANRRK